MNRLKWFGIGFFTILIIAVSLAWWKRENVETALFSRLIKKISPGLPFTIDSYQISKNLDSLSLSISFRDEHVEFNGPLHFTYLKKNGIQLQYEPQVAIDGASGFALRATLQTERDWAKLDKLEVEVPATDFKWKKYGVDSKSFRFNASYDDKILKSDFGFASLAWTDAAHADHAVNLSQFHANIEATGLDTAVTLHTEVGAKEAEILWGKFYLDLPLNQFPLFLEMTDEKNIDVRIGKQATLQIVLDDRLKEYRAAKVDFKISPIDVSEFIPWASKNLNTIFTPLQAFGDYEFKRGSINAQGSGSFKKAEKKFQIQNLSASGDSLAFRSELKRIAVAGLNFDLNYRSRDATHVLHVSSKQLKYAHFSGALEPTSVVWNEREFSIDKVPLTISGLPISLGKVSAKLKPELDLETSLKLKSVPITQITDGLCLSAKHIPPITVSGNFTNIHVSPSTIDPTGKFEADLFDGKIELNDIGIFELDTEVPETDFDLDWTGINLQKFGNWANFGETKGTLEGYAHDVVVQGSLPTQYHFQINVAPFAKSSRIEYSPEAMKNVVKVFTGANLDEQMPGIAGWLMFGWPSHVLGGYDVQYAGIRLTSEEGHIVVETLDPPGIVESTRKHFVLYGPRFKMPLTNSTYPLIIDATSMSNFVHQLITQLHSIKNKKDGSQDDENDDNPCQPPQL